jgi:hypothetical protein
VAGVGVEGELMGDGVEGCVGGDDTADGGDVGAVVVEEEENVPVDEDSADDGDCVLS